MTFAQEYDSGKTNNVMLKVVARHSRPHPCITVNQSEWPGHEVELLTTIIAPTTPPLLERRTLV